MNIGPKTLHPAVGAAAYSFACQLARNGNSVTLTPLEKWHPVSTTGSIEDFLVRNHGSGIVICEITIHRSLVAEGAALATARLQNGDVSVSGLECKGHDENLNELAERAFKELEAHLNRLCAQLISA